MNQIIEEEKVDIPEREIEESISLVASHNSPREESSSSSTQITPEYNRNRSIYLVFAMLLITWIYVFGTGHDSVMTSVLRAHGTRSSAGDDATATDNESSPEIEVTSPSSAENEAIGVEKEMQPESEAPSLSSTKNDMIAVDKEMRPQSDSKLPVIRQRDSAIFAIITKPCSGSSATIQFTTKILEAHGHNVIDGGQPLLHQKANLLKIAKERLVAKMTNPKEPTTDEIQAEVFAYLNDRAIKNGNVVIVKVGHLRGKVAKTLQQIGTKFAFTYRDNTLDRAVCYVRDCFSDESFGHQVHANGTHSDTCFNRRKNNAKVLAYFNDTEALVEKMKHWEDDVNSQKIDYEKYYKPAEDVSYERLFEFEYTNSTEVFERSLKAWTILLKNFEVQHEIIQRTLLPYKNTRQTRKPYNELIYNYDEVKEELQQIPEFKEYLSWR